jgi:hypothetical protein
MTMYRRLCHHELVGANGPAPLGVSQLPPIVMRGHGTAAPPLRDDRLRVTLDQQHPNGAVVVAAVGARSLRLQRAAQVPAVELYPEVVQHPIEKGGLQQGRLLYACSARSLLSVC